ncbi:unnamed protein product [Gongylonema pulchrum]|uniref:Uncharacterized protein n=1 Tax=Gongylonema pulchrum TaxID=637853 RepID=A0A3P7PQ45_9BILA|nr:unnamed protein product [Gongylonema pulchrum]
MFVFLRHHWRAFEDHPTVKCLKKYQNSTALFVFLRHHWRAFEDHPTVKCLKKYQNSSGSSWREVAKSISTEYRNPLDMLSISLTGVNRVVVTSSWILNITNYTLTCAQVSDVIMEAINADDHPVIAFIVANLSFVIFTDNIFTALDLISKTACI